ncbi:TPA: NACHT domain-containing protein [Elizabethkingia anophelis]|nr:NACHT domain-containing protein [Elizabethkingia anophelis]
MSTVISVGLTLISVFKEPILKKAKEIKDDYLFVYENGLVDYINNFHDKYSSVKTFIYRDEKINFYDIYYPTYLSLSNSGKEKTITDIDELFDTDSYITIIGSAGSGKSMLTKHIFLSTINACKSIPIIVELRNLNSFEGSIKDYIIKIITQNKISPGPKLTEEVLCEGNFIFILDGYDEIFLQNKEKRSFEIEEFVDNYNKNKFILTSRPNAGAESLQRFNNYKILPLETDQINEFVEKQFLHHEDKELSKRILEVINEEGNNGYEDYLSSPLLLSMFIFTFSNYPELPENKNRFYWNVFDTLCIKHDSFTKSGGWFHERRSNLKNDELEKILMWFSYISLFEGKYNFDYEYLKTTILKIIVKYGINSSVENIIYDLNISISILIQDGTDYTFPHKSLQEYFVARLIKSLENEQKKIIYSDQFSKLETQTSEGNSSLYSLCLEMDKLKFYEYYLMPRLKDLLKKDNQNEFQRIKLIFDFFNVTHGISKVEDSIFEIIIIIHRMPEFLFDMPNQLTNYHSFLREKKRISKSKKAITYLNSNLYVNDKGVPKIINITKDAFDKDDEGLFCCFQELEVIKYYNLFFIEIIKYASSIEKYLQEEKANTIELLGII